MFSATTQRLALGLLIGVGACLSDAEPKVPVEVEHDEQPQPTVSFATDKGAVTVNVELALTAEERRVGLMNRASLDADQGMLFVFPYQTEQRFWMKNTLIYLDMIFIDEGNRVVGVVANAEPHSEDSRTVGVPSRYVVEVNGGFAADHNITTGTLVTLPDLNDSP